ncbi:MAG: hypothetical protein KatS3mg124_0660 [Porticoccaceae bacterium]|nr:MAG: hypothetical protein KatS3mg124_0660 [Porticoccaceae bacterium]
MPAIPRPARFSRTLAAQLALAVGGAALVVVGFRFTFTDPPVAVLWLPSALGFFALGAGGARFLPAYWLGIFAGIALAGQWGHPPQPLLAFAAAVATASAVAILAGAALFRSLVSAGELWRRARHVPAFAAAATLTALLEAAGGAVVYHGFSPPHRGQEAVVFLRWLSVVLPSLLVFAPLPAAWGRTGRESLGGLLAVAGATLALLAAVHLLFPPGALGGRLALMGAPPLLAWAAWRHRHRGATLTLALFAAGSLIATALGRGPFAVPGLFPALQALYTLLALLALMGLTLAVDRNRQAAWNLRTAIPWSLLVGGVGMTVGVWSMGLERAEARNRQELAQLASEGVMRLDEGLVQARRVLDLTAAFFSSSQEVTEEEFARFGSVLLALPPPPLAALAYAAVDPQGAPRRHVVHRPGTSWDPDWLLSPAGGTLDFPCRPGERAFRLARPLAGGGLLAGAVPTAALIARVEIPTGVASQVQWIAERQCPGKVLWESPPAAAAVRIPLPVAEARGRGFTLRLVGSPQRPVINWLIAQGSLAAGTLMSLLAFHLGRTLAELNRAAEQRAREAARSLRRSEERFRVTLENAPVGLAIVTLEGRFAEVNRALADMLGYSREELRSLTFQEITHPDDLAADLDNVRRLLAGEIPNYRMEKRYLRRDGALLPARLHVALVRDEDGRPLHFVSQIVDISEERARQAALERGLRDKETLLKEVYHRVKNNLQVITSLFAMQARTARSDEVRAALAEASDRVRSMALVHEKLYQGSDLATVPLDEYLRDLARNLLAHGARDKRIRLELDLEPAAVDLERAVPLGLLVNELIANSLKHAFPDRGEGTVRIALERRPGRLVLTVADDGVGLAAEPRPDAPTLGLRLVFTLARQLDGEVHFQADGGTTAVVEIPLHREGSQTGSEQEERA